MGNTYNYLKRAFLEIKTQTRQNSSFLLLLLVLLSIPLSYAINGIAVGIYAFATIITFKKTNFRIEKKLVIPIFLYCLMVVSIIWSHDIHATQVALSKTLPLIILPACFMVSPPFSMQQKHFFLKYYSIGMLFFIAYYILKAIIRFIITKDNSVFFYHELVTKDVNAIYVSIYVIVAFFYFYIKPTKSIFDKLILLIMAVFVFLLSSKNCIVVFISLVLFYEFFYFKTKIKRKGIVVGLFLMVSFFVLFSSKIRNRFLIEFESNITKNSVNEDLGKEKLVNNISIQKAWTKETFQPNDYFPGTAFRIYQIRIFKEMLQEDSIFFTGYGLNATDFRIEEKGIEHNVFLGDATHDGYQKKNFHNQYIQIFAETGIFGFLLLLVLVFLNLKNAIKTKDFIHISFAVLMISLFLTESFLSRQRGVVFFTAMYCLFNTGITYKNLEKTT
jgi:hypothetical protein